ncbi:MAG: hypothetical protein ABNH38_04400 [Tateyamaria sp.]|jgi:hypothetical protein|uniref:hypothetical protein n=1 Tax=Tateyamaria sp. TaxID=1929288 RepID=UPI0032DC771B
MTEAPKSQIFLCDPGIADKQNLALDSFEQDFLCVARHFFETYENPDMQCWMQAFMVAERRFPPPFGATIAHAISLVVTALKTRGNSFSYYRAEDPLADYAVTREEQCLVHVLRHMRLGEVQRLQSAALMLCCGGDTKPFLAALERLCVITGDIKELRFQS